MKMTGDKPDMRALVLRKRICVNESQRQEIIEWE